MNARQRKTIGEVVWDWESMDWTGLDPAVARQHRDHLLYLIRVYGHDLTDDERAEVETELSYLVS